MNADERRFADWVSAFISMHQRLIGSLCALCVLCGEIKTYTAKSAKNAKVGAVNGCS